MLQAEAIAPVRFLALRGFATHQLAHTLDSLVRVSRRADGTPSASIMRTQFPKDYKSALHASVAAAAPPGERTPDISRHRNPC